MEYVSEPGLASQKMEDRRYQRSMAEGCTRGNTLVILPTGLGKTAVAARVAAAVLTSGKKVMMLAPTKPLVEQHREYFAEMLPSFEVLSVNGTMPPKKRGVAAAEADMLISTPQSVANDLENDVYGFDGFGLVIFDEAHRATGAYDYVTVADRMPPGMLTMGMTASPGSDIKKVEEICDNLRISRIDIRAEYDPDVAPYVHDTYVNKVVVRMPDDLLKVSSLFHGMLDHYFAELVGLKVANPAWPPSTTHMLTISQTLQSRLARGERTAAVFRGLSVQSICIKILHAIDLTETQGMTPLRAYMTRLNTDASAPKASKSNRELVSRKEYLEAWHIVKNSRTEHPKVSKTMSLVSQTLNSGMSAKIMVFAQYRETCDLLEKKLSMVMGAKVCRLVGQANGGLKQKDQIRILDGFRSGEYNVLVSTSVGEEGLDVASTDAVVFYEPVSSEIRTIQRRGRTGRGGDGEVFVLIAEGTRDEAADENSRRKERQMRVRLEALSSDLGRRGNRFAGQTGIDSFTKGA